MALTYDKMAGFATTEGQELEINLSALLVLRGLNSDLDFQLGTNVKGAGALDDVVFRYKPSGVADTWTTLYVQLKYKATKKVEPIMLTNPKGDFYLPKYFQSYLKIKEALSTANQGTLLDGDFDKSAFVIFTNAQTSGLLGKECRETLSEAEKFVWCDSGKVFSFEEDEEILKCLAECGDERQEFLGRLRLFCGQPDGNRLEAVIKKELQKVDPKVTQGVDFKSLLSEFLRHVKAWWEKTGKAEILHRGNDLLRASVLEMISQRTKKDYVLDLDFEEDVLASLRDSVTDGCKVVNVQASESSCRLSLTKLCQAFGGQPLVLDCEGLLANQGALLAQWRKGDVQRLIICTNGWTSSFQADYFKVVKDLLAIRDTPPIVFVSNVENSAFKAIANEFQESVRSFEDKFLFSQLKEASRGKVLAKEVSLQGHSTTFSKFFDDAPGGADKVLDACSVVEILDCVGSLTLGDAFDEGIDFYVDRHLGMSTVVKDTVFKDGALRETVTVRVMHCEASADLGLDKANVGLARVSATKNKRGLFDKAVTFLSSLKDSKSLFSANTTQTVSDLSNSLLVADKGDPEVFIGPTFALGPFECNSVGLRFGQQDAVTALWVRSSKHSTQAGFLFVSDKTSDNDARKLSDFHQSKHLLSLEDGQLRWIRSHGDIESIRPHIDEDQVTTFSPGNAMDVEDRLVLVCAEPGMGKSTLMSRLAKNTKAAHPHHFVFLIALNDHATLFAQGKHKDVLGFLCSANKIESHVHRSLLKFALEESGHVVVLFDGFDEIAPKYVKESCDLLESLMEGTKASKVWMTSRNSVKIQLETRISKFAILLRKFTFEDQNIFLKRVWAAKSKLSDKDLSEFIKRLFEITSQAVRDKEKDLMGIPLQTRMLAEVYESHVTGLAEKSDVPVKLDLLALLEQFVDKKFRVYIQSKGKVSPDSPMYENFLKISRKEYTKSHANAGLVLVLGDDITDIQRMKSVRKIFSKFSEKVKSGEEKTGFIDSIVDGKPRFIHRVFAEYFVAKWFSKNFADHRELVESKMFTADFAVIRDIFDRLLAKECILHTAVLNEDVEEVRTLLEREDVDVDAKDGGKRTALHLAASVGTSEDREINKRRGEILDLLIGKTSDFDQVDDVLGVSPSIHADVTRSWVAIDRFITYADNKEQFTSTLENLNNKDALETILRLDLHNIIDLFLKHGLEIKQSLSEDNNTLLHGAALFLSPGALHVLLEALDESDRADAVNSKGYNGNSVLIAGAFRGCVQCVTMVVEAGGKLTQVNDDGFTPLMAAAQKGHQEVVEYLLNNFNEKREGLSLHDYINMRYLDGWTAIHLAAEIGQNQVISFLLGKGGNPLSRDHHNSTPIHIAAGFKHPDALRVLLEALDEADRADAVNSKGISGNSVLIAGALGGCVQSVTMVVEAGGKLTQVNDDGFTPLMAAAYKGHEEEVEYMLNNFNEEIEGLSLHDYINMVNKDGWTAIHLAALEGQSKVIILLLGKGGDPLSRDNHNYTPFHIAAQFKHPDALRVLLEAMDEADRADAVNSKCYNGYSVLITGAFGGCVQCVALVVEAGGKLTQVNDDGRTPLMTAAQEGHQEVVEYLLYNFDKEREILTMQDYINMGDKDGWTAIHLAAFEGQSRIISYLLGKGIDPLSRDNDNSTPIHIAAQFKHPDALRVLMEALDEADRADAVNSKGKNGNSVLMAGALGGCVQCVTMEVESGGKLTQVDDEGRTPLMVAAQEGHQEVVEYLLNNFNEEREELTTHDFINLGDKGGCTAIHHAALKGHYQVISSLLGKAGDPLSREYGNNTPFHIAAAFKHPAALNVLLEARNEADRADAVKSKGYNGNSVLIAGAFGGNVQCVTLVVEAGGKLTQVNDDGHTPLMASAQEGHQEVVEYLMNNFNEEREGMSSHDYITMGDKDGCTAIHLAAQEGQSQVISSLLSKGGDPLSRDIENNTPIHNAADLKHPDVLRVLLEALDEADRADAVKSKGYNGNSVLIAGAIGGNVPCVTLVVEAGGKLTQVNDDGRTPLIVAAQEGHQEVVEYLLNNFNEEREEMTTHDFINLGDKDGCTAIHLAAQEDQSQVISSLLSKGGDPLSRDIENNTPFHNAADLKHPDVLRVLLEALDEADRADAVNSKGYNGNSVLIAGALGGCVQCVTMVVEAGGKLTQVDDDGNTPLKAAAHLGHQEVVKYFLNNFNEEREDLPLHDYINMVTKDGRSAIHIVALIGQSKVISYLLGKGGDPLSRDCHNSTPLHLAAELKHPDALRVLLEALDEADRADAVNSIDNDGDSVLICAALGGFVDCATQIVKAGGKLTQVNDNGHTPLMAAAQEGHQEVVEYLLNNFDTEREGLSQLDYFNMKDKEGKTALDLASLRCDVDCRDILQAFFMSLVD